MKKNKFLAILIVSIGLFAQTGRADEEKPKSLEAIEFLTGFGRGRVHIHEPREHLDQIPFLIAFDFNLKPLTQKLNFNPRSLLQFQVEPFFSLITRPQENIETGASFLLKAGFLPQTSKFQPYLKIGAGLDYMTLHAREQATQFNFTETAGAGFHYFFKKNTALTMDYRFRHLSNSDIEKPNRGLESHFILSGITYEF